MMNVELYQSKPREVEQIDMSMSDITDAASLDDRLRALSLAPVHLLGALPDGESDEDEHIVRNEMHFALRDTHEAVLRQADSVDAEDKSAVSSLTCDFYPSFDELNKRYMRNNQVCTAKQDLIDAENPSIAQGTEVDKISPSKRFRKQSQSSDYKESCIALFDVSPKKLIAAAVVMLLALIAIVASTSVNSNDRARNNKAAVLDSLNPDSPTNEHDAPEAILAEGHPNKPSETSLAYHPSKGSNEDSIGNTSVESKSDSDVINRINESSFGLDAGALEDHGDVQSGIYSTGGPSYEPAIQSPSQLPSNYPSSFATEEPSLLFYYR